MQVEMFKVRMQGQYGAADDKRLRDVAREMWRDWGFRQGVMRGYWVSAAVSHVAAKTAWSNTHLIRLLL